MHIPKRFREKTGFVLRRFFYLKMCYNRTHSYIGIPIDLLRDFAIIGMWLKLYGFSNPLLLACIFVSLLGSAVLLGHLDIKNKFAHIEQSVINSINPELMKIYEKHKK